VVTPQSGWTADLEARMAIKNLEARMKRRAKGRIVLEVHLLDGVCVHHRIKESDLTEEEVRRVMEEKRGVQL
jgi:hypothetical protein